MLHYQILPVTIHGIIIKGHACVNSKFKISFPKWNEKSELPDGSYSLCDIQDYFEYIIKKHNTVTDDPRIRIYIKISKTKSHLISK